MSDPSAQAAPQPFQFDVNNQGAPAPAVEPAAPAAPAAPAQPQAPELSAYAQSLLEGVPDDHKAILDQYLPKWDAGVERRVQTLEQHFGPVAELMQQGYTVEELATAAQLFDLAGSNPEAAKDIMARTFGWDQQPQVPGQPQPQVPAPGQPQQFVLPPEVQQALAQNNQTMQQIALAQQQAEAARVQQEAETQLDGYLTLLRQEKGDFDEDYVLNLMSMGIDGGEAVDRLNAQLEQRAQSNGGAPTSLPAPPVLSGGTAAVIPKPIHQASDAERKALVAQMLNAANAQAS